MRRVFLFLFFLFIGLGFAQLPFAKAQESLEVGYIEFPPFFYTDARGEAAGDLIQLAEKVFGKLDLKWHPTVYPTARLIKNMQEGETQVVMLIRHPLLEETSHYGKEPVATIRLRAYQRSNLPALNSLEELSGKSIVVIRGYGYSGWIKYIQDPKNKVRYHVADSHENALEMLARGRADYLLDYELPANRALKNVAVANLKSNLMDQFKVYFVVSKKTPNAKKLSERIDGALKKMGK